MGPGVRTGWAFLSTCGLGILGCTWEAGCGACPATAIPSPGQTRLSQPDAASRMYFSNKAL